MQTAITEQHYAHPDAKIAESILTSCVHCGFCNATCPTYQLEGVEMEGPRGRIYLIKSLLEGKISHEDSVVSHLDSCLSCLACESTCPSGVRYSHLIDSARSQIAEQYQRAAVDGLQRRVLFVVAAVPGPFPVGHAGRPSGQAFCLSGTARAAGHAAHDSGSFADPVPFGPSLACIVLKAPAARGWLC